MTDSYRCGSAPQGAVPRNRWLRPPCRVRQDYDVYDSGRHSILSGASCRSKPGPPIPCDWTPPLPALCVQYFRIAHRNADHLASRSMTAMIAAKKLLLASTMNPNFRALVESLEPKHRRLLAMSPVRFRAIPKIPEAGSTCFRK